MIEIFEGRIGGGKTYSAVERMANVLAEGQVICTNVRLRFENLSAMLQARAGVHIEPDQVIVLSNDKIPEFQKHVPWGDLRGSGKTRVLVVVDEAHLYFNARDWARTGRELLAFLTQSDKVSVDIIFISQSITNIDKQFRVLAQYVWRFRDLSKWRIAGLGILWPINQILACCYDAADGVTLQGRWFKTKNKTVFGCYETAALLTDFPSLEDYKTKRELKKVTKAKPMGKFIFIAVIIAGCVGAYFVKHKFEENTSHSGDLAAQVAAGRPSLTGTGSILSQVLPRRDEKVRGLYDIYDERFVSWNGTDKALKTDTGWYQLGEMSNKGLVVAVSDRRAKIEQPDGRKGWVVARDSEFAKPQPEPLKSVEAPKASATPRPSLPAPTPSYSDREQTRIRRNLEKHYVGGQEVEN